MAKKYVPLLVIILLSIVLATCKSSEQTTKEEHSTSTEPTEPTVCTKLAAEAPENALLFLGDATADREEVASEQAKKESIIEMVQFFQRSFIEGNQLNIFGRGNPLGNEDEKFRRSWAETSYQLIAEQHNQQAFSHAQHVGQDSANYSVENMLFVSDDWVRRHWKKSLAAVDSSFYHRRIKTSSHYDTMQNMDIQKSSPCS